MDRTQAAQAVAKVFAYLACGKRSEARQWAQQLIGWLQSI